MLSNAPPDSNAERQRRFRQRHPGYNDKYRVRSTPVEQARMKARRAEVAAAAASQDPERIAAAMAALGLAPAETVAAPTPQPTGASFASFAATTPAHPPDAGRLPTAC